KARTHRKAEQMGAFNTEVIHQSQNVARHVLTAISVGLVRLGAFAMAAAIECDHPHPASLEGAVPAEAAPVLVAIGSKAVDENDRPALPRCAHIIEGDRQPAGIEGR